MEDTLIKSFKSPKVFLKNLKNEYEYQEGAIQIRNILKEPEANIVLFIIDREQGLIEHAASADAIVYILEGEIEFTVSSQNYNLKDGSLLQLPAGTPHSFLALEKSKMLLIVFN